MANLVDAPNHVARSRWRQLRVLLTGGGARRQEVEHAIRQNCPMYPWNREETVYNVAWHEPAQIDFGARGDGQDLGETALFAVAHGLSVPRREWPIHFAPNEIEVQEPNCQNSAVSFPFRCAVDGTHSSD